MYVTIASISYGVYVALSLILPTKLLFDKISVCVENEH